ncbi:hypothetical protein AMAG_17137 [Allomyces macrogynus ATCC 38327]|uniref:Uncharacterized protein n=1 Tax=Allomyces macrogynus (strain ATCC 38327) TaxID=578462 RepID=A0A0L0TDB9_ALLM3|nr:hypothetical protein AMAG_17137 [Allomyces macrogynus ATCC 38327]|eukprot:KNE72898.1 hypothetical protein AMAG_17137 [Allomyces macrogynus ATCC 38327]
MGQFTSSIVHSIVWFGKDIVSRFSAARHDRDQWFMYNKRQAWWKKYNYVLATGLDIGTALSALLVTLVLQNNGFSFPEWFLNDPNGNVERFGEYGDWCFLGLPEKLP